jgi:hypothetical protein
MNLDRLREWLIQKGVSAEELDEFIESPIVRDIGEGLALSLMNDDDIGQVLMMLMMEVEMLNARITELEEK